MRPSCFCEYVCVWRTVCVSELRARIPHAYAGACTVLLANPISRQEDIHLHGLAACDVSLTLAVGHGPQHVQVLCEWPRHMPEPDHVHALGNLHAQRRQPRTVQRIGGDGDAARHMRHKSWLAGRNRSHVLQRWVRIATKSTTPKCIRCVHVCMYTPMCLCS